MATETQSMECDSTCPEIDPEKAEAYKLEGNEAFAAKDYTTAIRLYSQAIDHNPACANYYGNRSAAYMMLEDYHKALSDAQQSISIDEGFVKGYLRAAKCQTMLGSPELSLIWYDKVLTLQPRNKQAIDEKQQVVLLQRHMRKVDEEFIKQDYRTCLFHLDRCLDMSPTCVKFKTLRAEALAMCRRIDECLSLSHDLLRMNINNCGAIYAKGLCHYYQDDTTKAHQLFQKVLRIDPDHSKARIAFKRSKQLNLKKDEGNEAFKSYDLKRALDLYTEALDIDPNNIITNAKLYCNRALMRQKLGDIEEAISDCSKAIGLDENYLRAYQRRAGLYQQNEQHEECVRDWKRVCEQDKSIENRQSLKEAEKLLKMSQRKNYYKILGVEKTASDIEIKKAYRRKAMLHHPDRHATAEQNVKEEEEKKFKEVSEAYSILSDPKKKVRYDNGHDLEDMGGAYFDPSEVFTSFFGHNDMGGGYGGDFPGFGGGGGSPFFSFRMS